MIDLDDINRLNEIDRHGMLDHVLGFPQTCADAWKLAHDALPHLNPKAQAAINVRDVRRIVIIGMGGSAIGGDLLAGLVAEECQLPIYVHRSYRLPAFASGPQTLIIACSHSGNTEETLTAFQEARSRGALLLALTTGGELATMANECGAPLLHYSYEAQPRAALGYPFSILLATLCHFGLVPNKAGDLAEALDIMRAWQAEIGPRAPVASNPAKRLAGLLMERLPVVYGAGMMAPVARRWKTQFNENAKRWSFFEEMPELNHNSVVGYAESERIREWASVIMLRSRYDSSRIQSRWRVTRQLLLEEGVGADQIRARGESRLAQMLSLIHFGDLASVYLALASEIDPTPVEPITYLKAELAKGQ